MREELSYSFRNKQLFVPDNLCIFKVPFIINSKNEKDNLTKEERNELRQMIQILEDQLAENKRKED